MNIGRALCGSLAAALPSSLLKAQLGLSADESSATNARMAVDEVYELALAQMVELIVLPH